MREATDLAAAIHRAQAGYRVEDFLQAFKLEAAAQALVRKAALSLDA
jgi:hypothetical protein